MAELKNEGLPYRLYAEHPEIVPVGWDGAPAPTRTVDYLAPAFLAEADRWYAAVMPILAARLQPCGGPVIGVQLDNEIGMLAWVSNSPDLTDDVLADLRRWCAERYGDGLAARYPVPLDPPGWAAAVRSPEERWAAALRVDLGLVHARPVRPLRRRAGRLGPPARHHRGSVHDQHPRHRGRQRGAVRHRRQPAVRVLRRAGRVRRRVRPLPGRHVVGDDAPTSTSSTPPWPRSTGPTSR